ncbi:MAG: NAD(P)H-hydrate dehydratase [Campylobacterales bacterium]|nr:NAD(P)H-hydrate dehydratase [Campylobacterales bacterium]
MQKLFDEVASLDKRCYEKFALSEDILMENAAHGMANFIRKNFAKGSKIILACGSGNNGADGLACGRMLHGEYAVSLFYVKQPKSEMAILQDKRAKSVGVKICTELMDCDVLVDAVVGTGFDGAFDDALKITMKKLNSLKAFKIACDIPSGLKQNGECVDECFVSDVTLTMGALKKRMFLDEAKEFVGKIEVIELGISRAIYETQSSWNLLDLEDLKLPHRTKKDSHKGSFGHLALACGNKSGASIMSAETALRFGAGLVTLVVHDAVQVPQTIMYSTEVPKNTTALACGMGLGDEFSNVELKKFLDNSFPLIADADIFHMCCEERGNALGVPILTEILKRENVVLTPHAKEFVALLKRTELADISVEVLQKNRFKYVELFTQKFPHAVLLLKGANVIVACANEFFINPHGTSALAKGGSGDVLSGLIGSLLAQGYTPLEAAKNGSLAHAKLACGYKGADFSLTPYDLINGIAKL